jgi:transposase-like protein
LIEQQRVSGQTVKAFCAEHGLGQASFYAWRRHLYQEASQGAGPSKHSSIEAGPQSGANEDQGSNVSGFVRLDPQTDRSNGTIEVQFPCGTTLRCSSSHLPDLVRLLKVNASEAERC